ncbi:MAG: hypothetical protein ACI8W7_003479, partial [Gammaproteobacteria bacterium]
MNEPVSMDDRTTIALPRSNIEMPGEDAQSIRTDTLHYFHF